MFVDTHCHLHDEKLSDCERVVCDFLRDGVDFVINAACCALTSEAGKNLAEKFSPVYFMTGCHPSDINGFDDAEFDRISRLTSHDKCVAVGEIGLDYHWEGFDKDRQKAGFIKQIELAYQCKLPISIHSRDATSDTLKILKDNKNKLQYGAVMHCFSGSKETAKELLDLGLYISFAGPLTFKNARGLVEVAEYVPIDRCLTETDCPYLSPHPLRGKINEPKNVSLVTARLAEIKGVDLYRLAEQIKQNAKTLFYKI